MDISVTEPIGQAYAEMKRILFKPFNIGKWFLMGFCVFLANLGDCEHHGGNGGNRATKGHYDSPREFFEVVYNWICDHWELIVTIGWAIILVGVLIWLLFLWLSSRGKFMFLDGVVRNRGAVVEPWHQFRDLANSLLLWRIIIGIIAFAGFILSAAICSLIARPDIEAWRFSTNAISALITFGILGIISLIIFTVIDHMLTDFITPVMYRRNILTGEAINIFRYEILSNQGGNFFLFYLMKLLLGIAAFFMIAFIGIFCTCCIGFLPYISSVVFLPFCVFFRCYSLYFLEQFDPQWRLLGTMAEVKQENL